MKNKPLQTLKYILFDTISAATAWVLFFYYRIEQIDGKTINISNMFIKDIITVTIAWIFLYAFFGFYKNIYRKSRLREIGQTFASSVLGVTILFFSVLNQCFCLQLTQFCRYLLHFLAQNQVHLA